MSEYTPDTGAVRAAYTRAMRQAFIAATSEHIAEFDRWLSGELAKAELEGHEQGYRSGYNDGYEAAFGVYAE